MNLRSSAQNKLKPVAGWYFRNDTELKSVSEVLFQKHKSVRYTHD